MPVEGGADGGAVERQVGDQGAEGGDGHTAAVEQADEGVVVVQVPERILRLDRQRAALGADGGEGEAGLIAELVVEQVVEPPTQPDVDRDAEDEQGGGEQPGIPDGQPPADRDGGGEGARGQRSVGVGEELRGAGT